MDYCGRSQPASVCVLSPLAVATTLTERGALVEPAEELARPEPGAAVALLEQVEPPERAGLAEPVEWEVKPVPAE